MATKKKKRAVPIIPINPKAEPKIHVQFARNSRRLQIIARLTAAEEKGLYEKLRKRYGK
jgi:hypothetical protein